MPPPSDGLSCAEVLDRLEAYVDDELELAASTAITRHLRACPACVAEHELALTVQRELQSWATLDAPPQVLEAVHAATRAPRSPATWLRPLAAMAAGLVLAASVLIVSDLRQAERQAEQLTADEVTRQVELALAVIGVATGRISADVKEQLDHKVVERTLHLCLNTTPQERGEP
jgi:anti-sigma factor (TIGR02949 family)